MVNVEGIVLYKLLEEQSLDAYADLKACFFTGAYSPIYRMIHKFYTNTGHVPSFEELKLVTKDPIHINSLESLEVLEVPDVELTLAIEALLDQYAQSETLEALDNFLSEITLFNAEEIKEGIGRILLDLDSKLDTNESIMTADQFNVFQKVEETNHLKMATGISNWFDSFTGGYYRQDLILIGGKRGSGKSLHCANLAAAQYEAGFIAPYFTIEMTGIETFQRIMAILARVDFEKIKRNTLLPEDKHKLAKVRAGMFVGADDLYHEFIQSSEEGAEFEFERKLLATKTLKKDGQILIIDDREMSISQIDLNLQKLIAEHGDRIQMALVDYVNQVTISGNSDNMFDWKDQTAVSKQLKNLARKYDVAMVSPYQIDDTGQTRFSKGILDACDIALLLDSKAADNSLVYECTKSRASADDFKYRTSIDWKCLRIDPAEIELVTDPPEGGDDHEGSSYTPKGPGYNPKALQTGEDDL